MVINDNFIIDVWEVSPTEGVISDKNGKQHQLEPKAMALLCVLAKANGNLVSREQLFNQVWPGVVVTEYALNTLISTLRHKLQDKRGKRAIIETRSKLGYRLVPEVIWHTPSQFDIELNNSTTQTSQIITSYKVSPDDALIATPVVISHVNEKKRLPRFAILMVSSSIVIIIIYLSFDYFSFQEPKQLTPSIAVLPFEVFDNNINSFHFANGLAEEIIHRLTDVPKLKVIASTSSFQFRDKAIDIKAIGEKLGVTYVLEGSVRTDNGIKRVTVKLIQSNSKTHLWSKTFDVGEKSLFEIQKNISLAITHSLTMGLSGDLPENERIHPNNEQALSLFLTAQSYAALGTDEGYSRSLILYQEAIDISPNYALAYAAVGMNYLLLHQYQNIPLTSVSEKALIAINRSLELSPELPEGHTAKALYYTYNGDLNAAEKEYRKAISINQNLRIARHNYGFMLWLSSRYSEAYEQFSYALSINPLSNITHFALADTLVNLNKVDDAEKQYQRCLSLFPNYLACQLGYADIHLINENFVASKNLLTLATNDPVNSGNNYLNSYWAKYYLTQGEFVNALNFWGKLSNSSKDEYSNLRTQFLLMWGTQQGQTLHQQLELKYQKKPNNYDLIKILALSRYYMGDCNQSIQLYEFLEQNNVHFHSTITDFSLGLSHAANMAYCYQQQGNKMKKGQSLKRLKKVLAELPLNKSDMLSIQYIKAKYLLLNNQRKTANERIEKIYSEVWPMLWLNQYDGIFKTN
jgi:TolB-like protein/DNA-binding winged helix-turn-helix (wHTH) protein/Tfp pilus assembly protein PilF